MAAFETLGRGASRNTPPNSIVGALREAPLLPEVEIRKKAPLFVFNDIRGLFFEIRRQHSKPVAGRFAKHPPNDIGRGALRSAPTHKSS